MRSSFAFARWLPLGLLAIAACGGSVDSGGGAGADAGTDGSGGSAGSGGSGGAGGSAGSGGSGGTGGAPSPVGCPDAPPDSGSSCSHPGVTCTYGDSVLAECRDQVSCDGGTWTRPHFGPSCPPPTTACPNGEPADQSTCGDVGAQCGYAITGDVCTCADCPPFGPACLPQPPSKWYCRQPAHEPGCPTVIPNQGAACPAGLTCRYPSGCGIDARCVGGAWTWETSPCPAIAGAPRAP